MDDSNLVEWDGRVWERKPHSKASRRVVYRYVLRFKIEAGKRVPVSSGALNPLKASKRKEKA